jgi:hypothetical protein
MNWAITALFYAAVHYVDAYFVARTNRPIIHSQRRRQIHDSVHLKGIEGDYRMLQVMSEEARYEMAAYGERDFMEARELLQAIRITALPKIR